MFVNFLFFRRESETMQWDIRLNHWSGIDWNWKMERQWQLTMAMPGHQIRPPRTDAFDDVFLLNSFWFIQRNACFGNGIANFVLSQKKLHNVNQNMKSFHFFFISWIDDMRVSIIENVCTNAFFNSVCPKIDENVCSVKASNQKNKKNTARQSWKFNEKWMNCIEPKTSQNHWNDIGNAWIIQIHQWFICRIENKIWWNHIFVQSHFCNSEKYAFINQQN